MEVAEKWKEILKIQKFRRIVSYTGFYCFATLVTYAYTSNTTRAGISRADQYYAAYPAGTELLTDTSKLYKAALGNCFEIEEWGPIEFSVMAKHFDRQGKPPYAYHAEYEEIEMRRLKQEFDEVMEMYKEACRESSAAREKANMLKLEAANDMMSGLDNKNDGICTVRNDIARLSQSIDARQDEMQTFRNKMQTFQDEMRARHNAIFRRQDGIFRLQEEISQNQRQSWYLLLAGLVLIVSLGLIIAKEVYALKNI